MNEIRTSGPLLFSDPNSPTRVGEIINSLNEIYDIPMPRLGMSVYIKDEGVNYTITKLESKLIDGVLVPDAKVAGYELQTGKSIAWNSSSNVNDYVVAGVYNITGERLNVNDGLPIANSNPGHTISARLVVLDSSITGTGDSQDKCITQVLTLSNRTGEDGNMYIRTSHGGNINSLSWKPWATLQTNTNVGQVDDLDNLKDNGIYSGVWTKGHYAANPLTFVCIVINDYFVGITPRRISQFVYGLSKMGGSVVYQSRVWDDSKNAWGDWEILNRKEISSMISTEIAKLVDEAPENLDTLKEFAEWIEGHGKEVAEMLAAITANADNLAETKKNIANQLITTSTADNVSITGRNEQSMRINFSADIPAATTEKAGVMSAKDKIKLNNLAVEGADVDLNTYYLDGVYVLSNKKLTNVPILNDSVVSVRLTVLTAYDGVSPVITQVLNLNNLGGGEGNVYIRSHQNNSWKPWGKLQTNVEVGSVETLDNLKDNGIYSGVWTGYYAGYPLTFVCVVINDYFIGVSPRRISQFVYGLSKFDGSTVYQSRVWDDSKNAWGDWEILNQKEISSMISDEIKKVTDGVDPEKLDSLKDLIAWVDAHGGEVAEIKNDIQANKTAIETEVERATEAERKLEEKIAKEKTALINGDTIVGQAREIHSRNGKTVTDSFLARTTAGSSTIGDGVASVKRIGGNIVKNLVSPISANDWSVHGNSVLQEIYNGVVYIANTNTYTGFRTNQSIGVISGCKYYISHYLYAEKGHNININIANTYIGGYTTKEGWCNYSFIATDKEVEGVFKILTVEAGLNFYATKPLLINLTEMFGVSKEPTKEECDKMFGTMDALPQGLTVAQPTGLKSIGFNQWNPANVLLNKSIVENAIEDDVADRHIAVVECLPCKTGTGENNGYVIGYGEGDTWSDDGIEVYLTPLNPLEVEGELYMHKLEKDETYATYVPQIKGYLLVVTPTTQNFCAHFLWSGDREVTDYEPYVESVVTLPEIPEMSEWGIAGVTKVNGVVTQDTIDLESNIYTRRIGKTDLGDLVWSMTTGGNFYAKVGAKGGTGIITDKYTVISSRYDGELASEKCIWSNPADSSSILVRDSSYSDAASFKNAVKGSLLYYTLATPEEYAIIVRTAPNYVGSDYGVEEFTGSKVPLVANILFYMRSLVSETRNFLDRLMARLGISDATAVADKIADAIIPTEETDVEPTEVIEE